MNFTSSRLVEVLLSPKQIGISSPTEMQVFLVFGSLTFECLWKSRNLALFEKVEMDIHKAIWHIRTRMQEHLRVVPESILIAPLARDVKWSSPPKGTIKINCDAAIGQDRAHVAIVTRDWRRALVFSLSKTVETNIPVSGE